jgi:hypothetical protein
MTAKVVRVGSGSAWWGDRIAPARLNAEQGALDYLCFETMAEATVSAAQVRAPGVQHQVGRGGRCHARRQCRRVFRSAVPVGRLRA